MEVSFDYATKIIGINFAHKTTNLSVQYNYVTKSFNEAHGQITKEYVLNKYADVQTRIPNIAKPVAKAARNMISGFVSDIFNERYQQMTKEYPILKDVVGENLQGAINNAITLLTDPETVLAYGSHPSERKNVTYDDGSQQSQFFPKSTTYTAYRRNVYGLINGNATVVVQYTDQSYTEKSNIRVSGFNWEENMKKIKQLLQNKPDNMNKTPTSTSGTN